MKEYTILIVALIAAVALAFVTDFVPISLEGLDATDLATKFFGILLASIFVERAVEVMMIARFGPTEEEIIQPVRTARAHLKVEKAVLKAEASRPVLEGQAAEAMLGEIQDKENSLRVLRGKIDLASNKLQSDTAAAIERQTSLNKQKIAFSRIATTILGLSAAMVGFRVFGQFLPLPGEGSQLSALESSGQLAWFHAFDVAITTLVLAGGADGLHNTLGQFLKKRDELTNPVED